MISLLDLLLMEGKKPWQCRGYWSIPRNHQRGCFVRFLSDTTGLKRGWTQPRGLFLRQSRDSGTRDLHVGLSMLTSILELLTVITQSSCRTVYRVIHGVYIDLEGTF